MGSARVDMRKHGGWPSAELRCVVEEQAERVHGIGLADVNNKKLSHRYCLLNSAVVRLVVSDDHIACVLGCPVRELVLEADAARVEAAKLRHEVRVVRREGPRMC